jgi:hypothetical protein
MLQISYQACDIILKIKIILEQAMKAQRGSIGTDLFS